MTVYAPDDKAPLHVVIDDGLVQLRDPAVRGRVEGACPPPGAEVTVKLERADPATRTVAFSA